MTRAQILLVARPSLGRLICPCPPRGFAMLMGMSRGGRAVARPAFKEFGCRDGHWEAKVQIGEEEARFMCMTDARPGVDRMRFVMPITKVKGDVAKAAFLNTILEANFHSALDARYAIDQGYVWSAFIHPLSPLTTAQTKDAIQQVLRLYENFGTTFASTNLAFIGGPMLGGEMQLGQSTHQWREDQLMKQLQGVQDELMALKLYHNTGGENGDHSGSEDESKDFLSCPITHTQMKDPVIACDGHTYEREAIEAWFANHNTSPLTSETLPHLDLVTNYLARAQILEVQARKANEASKDTDDSKPNEST